MVLIAEIALGVLLGLSAWHFILHYDEIHVRHYAAIQRFWAITLLVFVLIVIVGGGTFGLVWALDNYPLKTRTALIGTAIMTGGYLIYGLLVYSSDRMKEKRERNAGEENK